MIIDINILKRLGERFGIFPISAQPKLQKLLQNPDIFIKAPDGIEPVFTGGGYQWDDEISGYRFGNNQKMFLFSTGIVIWTFKDILARGLSLDSVQKWTSGDAEYPMGKANAFFIVYGKLTGQDLGEGETAGDNVPDGETEPGEGGGLATADDENAPPYSKDDIQKMLKGEFPADAPAGPKASMDTAIPDEPSSPMSGPPPSRLAKGSPPNETGSEAEKIIRTLYKQAHINPKAKLSKQNPIRIPSDDIIDLYKRAKAMPPEEGEKLIAFLKSGAILPLMEGHIAKSQLDGLLEHIVGGIVDEVEKAKKKAKAKREEPQGDGKLVNTIKKLNIKDPTSYNPDDPVRKTVRNWNLEAKSKGKPKKKQSLGAYEKGEADRLKSQAASDKEKTAGMNRMPPAHSQMDWEPEPKKSSYGQPKDGPEKWLEDLANKLWKDPEDIGHNHQGWKIKKVVPHGPDTTAYLLTLTKQYHKSRIFINRNGKWFWKDPIDRHQSWQPIEGPQMEPSIEQEQSGAGGAGGMTTTSAVSPVTGPNAFDKKKKWTEKFQGRKEKELSEMTTTGGGNGTSLGTTGYNVPGAFGDRLSHRKDHIEVLGYKMTPEGEKEYSKSADKLYEVIRKNVTTMLREGLPSKETSVCRFCSKPLPYMGASECPSCKKAQPEVPGIRPGERSYEKRFPSKPSKALESQGLGADFDAAQARYDAQTPEEDEILINCEKCGAEEAARITTKGSKGSSWWWEAVCTKCGQTFGNDNF